MHIAVLILTLIGALGGSAIAMKWISDYNAAKGIRDLAASLGETQATGELDHLRNTAYVWLGVSVLALIGGVMAMRRQGKPAAGLLLIAAIVPGVMEPKTFLTGAFLGLAGLLSLTIKPKTA